MVIIAGGETRPFSDIQVASDNEHYVKLKLWNQ